ncbi:MAG: ATP-binding cassette domain-containing protein [Gammaproteobacteria bacterium]|nr:ATP-binding cassette domain-containing protein [Gammaproteobacteria bacterium]
MNTYDVNTGDIAVQGMNITKSVSLGSQEINILCDVSLDIKRKHTVSITGSSGSGKTSLLGVLAGLDLPDTGSVQLLGNELTNMNEDQRATVRCGEVGFVFQSFHLLPNLTALENISLALEVTPGSVHIRERSMTALERVGLSDHANHLPSQMSGGEQQRVALARSVVINPSVLFADEPTGNLDYRTSDQICDLLFSLCKDDGTTLVLVTHNQQLAARCDDQIILEAGRRV